MVPVAVIAESMLADELVTIPEGLPADSGLLLLVVPELHSTYTGVFAKAATWADPSVGGR